ncbi:MAG: GIY-YIG nuclease family protein [Balneolaceae bacterium]
MDQRILNHKYGQGSHFATKYNLTVLLYYEKFPNIKKAIEREKQLKNWHRKWKFNLVKKSNPALKDLWNS